MLMKTRAYVDYSRVAPEHAAIHEVLCNWARWCRDDRPRWAMHPMWRHLVEKEQRENPEVFVPVNAMAGHAMEKTVFLLPDKHRFAIRWWYVFRGNPAAASRQVAVSKERLAQLVNEGRSMLVTRTRQ